MAIQDYKVSEAYSGRDIASLSDRPNQDGMTAAQLKARFDQLGKEVIPNYNDLIDLLKALLEDGSVTNGHTHNVDNLVDGIVNRLFTEVLKLKLDDIEEGAEVNQNAFSSIKIGSNTANASLKTDTFEIIPGLNIVASINPTTKQITLSATGDIATVAVQSLIEDIGEYFTSLNVEGALQEVGENITEVKSQLAQTETKLEGFHNVRWYGAKGDGSTDDTIAIQTALDNARGALFFPKGIYKITSGLVLTRNLDLIGFSKRDSVIRGDGLPSSSDLLTVAITNNFGFGDVRNWRMENITLLPNASGRHGLSLLGASDFQGALQMLSSSIRNCDLRGHTANSGHGLFVKDNFAHGLIELNTITTAYLACYDANTIVKNLFSADSCAITFDLINGVRNNVVRDNTIVNRDGSIHIINGSNIRFVNNQCEQPSMSQNQYKTMVWIEGRDQTRVCENIVISENNFGGGTNLDRLIYIDNANKAVVEKNNLIAVNIAEIELTQKAKYCVIKFDNFVKTQNDNPRTRTAFKANIVDNGIGTAGVLKDGSILNRQNGWVDGDFYKDENGVVHFHKTFNAGLTSNNTVIGTLPVGFRPAFTKNLVSASSGGSCVIQINRDNGEIKSITSIPSNLWLTIPSFTAGTTE